jgi:hypothetical protein
MIFLFWRHTMKLDLRRHRNDLLRLIDGEPLHVVTRGGTKRTLRVRVAHATVNDTSCTEMLAEAGALEDGRWALYFENESGSHVKLFATREQLCQYLLEWWWEERPFLHVLWQLYALTPTFDPGQRHQKAAADVRVAASRPRGRDERPSPTKPRRRKPRA